MIRWIVFIVFVLIIDFYAFQSIKTITKNKIVYIVYWLLSVAVVFNVIYTIYAIGESRGLSQQVMLSFGLFILTFSPKIIALIVLFGEDIFRIFKSGFNYFSRTTTSNYFPDRRAFVSKMALGLAAIPFSSVLYGMMRGKYNYQVIKHTLFFDDLPNAFDGYKLTHLSDIHSGSFDDEEKIAYGIDLINEQASDVILFTGDIVNNTADEMTPWIPLFSKLKAKDGKYAVLGNHDYGEYVRWKTLEEKEQNFQAIKDIHPKIGFNLLLNESVYLEKENEKIALVGVENWGTRFKKVGDLDLASSKINKEDFKILMSHDPSHWEQEIKSHTNNYHLTLSGHTHGMQFGIEVPGIKWSPVQYIYKHWAGIYKEFGKYINVNRGFGFLAFPGRIGIWPEITVITLKKK
ncbi:MULTISPECIES: metallophosphoesterase [Flavobacteriaceae]|uniref:Metallophosphoesterase n=2 Tax=Flavobacteriaceae TaxID=49546 RepID=A0A4Y8AU70_9FLAO|nr:MULTISPECIES: metallophosphoesterase [Flavobacteriaceae]TEW74932.1 metallophosphoesterase [Gramella jeungdoensis]GGK42948.1 phosphoesterase [Lutibacter litoralis]